MSLNVPAESSASQPIGSGVTLGGRFEVDSQQGTDALGTSFLARDQKTRKPIEIYVLAPALAGDKATYESFRDEARVAAKLKHKSLAAIYGVGTHGRHEHFIAREWITGQTLSALAEERKQSGEPLSLRGVYNVITHVCKALSAMHEHTCHGAVRPGVVWVSRTGRIKLGDLGVGSALVKTRKWTLLPAMEQAFLAPEIKAGGVPDVQSDVFGVGALLYVLLTGRSPIDQFAAPSHVHPDATPELDAVLMRCLAMDKTQRYGSPEEIVSALLPLAASAPEASPQEFGADVEIDVDIAVSIAPPAPSQAPHVSVVLTNAQDSVPAPAPVATQLPRPPMMAAPHQRPSPDPLAAARLPNAPVPQDARRSSAPPGPQAQAQPQPRVAARPAPAPAAPAEEDIGELTNRLTKNDAARWMAVKNGMDHGPFTTRELIKLIVEGEILEEHSLFNMTSNERKKLAEYPDFAPFVQQYRIRRDEKDHQVALAHSSKVEKRSTAAKVVILGASAAVLLLAGAGYVMSRQTASEKAAQKDMDLAALYESGQVKISGTAGILKHTPRAGGGRRGGGSPGPGGFSSYEDAMNQAMELGDVTKGGGERQLTSADVAGVMNRNLNRLFSCVSDELRSGGKLGGVTIDIAILGSGKVMGTSVNRGSAGFKRCIASKVQSISFPSFPAPRMGARYSFNVD